MRSRGTGEGHRRRQARGEGRLGVQEKAIDGGRRGGRGGIHLLPCAGRCNERLQAKGQGGARPEALEMEKAGAQQKALPEVLECRGNGREARARRQVPVDEEVSLERCGDRMGAGRASVEVGSLRLDARQPADNASSRRSLGRVGEGSRGILDERRNIEWGRQHDRFGEA
ncbi:MAG: hypothetical protein NTU88_00055, partial [Armatimonadetes bacterium]|nr:hypothetical protein [Armatimonadota bacterium]